ncbi:hypothetical protein BDC45DRAFT_502660 [Circinella umbellata]|nr:hypothetical protein BDC45DRAFT_502660 [Circinella umbellata]
MTISEKESSSIDTTQVSNKHFDGRDQRLRRRHNMSRHGQNSSEHNLKETKDHVNLIVEEEEHNSREKIMKRTTRNNNNSETISRDITEEKEKESNSENINNGDNGNDSSGSTSVNNNSSNDRHYMDTEDMDFNFRSIMNDEDLFIESNTSKNPLVIDSDSVQTESNSSRGSNKRRRIVKTKKRSTKQQSKKKRQEEDELDESDNGEKYEVEAILGHKIYRNMVVKYEIKWVGYPHKFNTWEPSSSIHQDCPKICIAYWSKHEEKPSNAPTATMTTTTNKEKNKPTLSFKQKEYMERIKNNKITNEDLHYSLRNQGFELAYDTEFPTDKTDWIFEMRQIHLVQKIEGTDQILAYVSWQNRKKTVHVVQELHEKCPGELISYYEARIRFED